MERQVGDKVKIKEDLKLGEFYGEYEYDNRKDEFKGQITTITEDNGDNYDLDIDAGKWCWTDEMLEDIVEQKENNCYNSNCQYMNSDNKCDINSINSCKAYVNKEFIFNVSEFKNKNIAINCKTEEEAGQLFDIFIKNRIQKWGNRDDVLINYTGWVENDTIYEYDDGIYVGTIDQYPEYVIYEFSEIDFSQVYNKESIDKVTLNNRTEEEFDITKTKYITREQLANRGFKTGDIVGDKCNYGIVYGNKVSYITAHCQETINPKAYCEIIPIELIENKCDIVKALSKFMYSNLKDYYGIKDYFIPIQEKPKQKPICKVEFVVDADNLREFILEDDDKVVENEIVAVHTGATWQYAKIKEIEKKYLFDYEINEYKKCRKLSN